MSPLDLALVAAAFALIVVGADIFTNGVEWLGVKLKMGAGATGSVLAALGTGMPETLIPIVTILFTKTSDANEVGLGAIVGSLLMLATLVFLLMGVTAYLLRGRRGRTTLHVDKAHATRDLNFFLVLCSLALALALLPKEIHFLKDYVGWIFLPAYLFYLYIVLRKQKRSALDVEEAHEEAEAFEDLAFASYLKRAGVSIVPTRPPLWLVLAQTLIAFGGLVVGAEFFSDFVQDFSHALRLDTLLVSLILAPIATQLPEAANSLIWLKEGKDVIALGNVVGALVLGSTVPVTIGVLFTPWEIGSFGTLSALLALISGFILWLQLRGMRGNALPLRPLMLGGSLYLVFVGYVLWSVIT